MPSLNLRDARRIGIAGGEVRRLAGPGFAWDAPEPGGGGDPGPVPEGGYWAWANGDPIAWESGEVIGLAASAPAEPVIG